MIESTPLVTWLACGLALITFLFLAWAEYRHRSTGRSFAIRVFLLFLAIAALLGVALKPVYKAAGGSTTIVLNGAGENKLDSLLQVYPAAGVLSLQPHKRYPLLEGTSYLQRYATPGSPVIVVGNGLTEQELEPLKAYQLGYVPAGSTAGVLSLAYSRMLRPSDTLKVQGVWLAPAADGMLRLSQGGIALDSVVAKGEEKYTFVLRAPTQFIGTGLYQLYWLSQQGDTLGTYPLPVQVSEPQALRLALLTSYPEPESKYLKELLALEGHKLHYSARLAPGKSVNEWINLPRQPILFNKRGLSGWDVLILSTGFYGELRRNAQQELITAVQQQGVGLLLYPGAETSQLSLQDERIQFAPEEVKETLLLGGMQLPLEYRPIRKFPSGWQVAVKGKKGVVAITRRYGAGQVLISGGVASYRLLLIGKPQAYQQFWHRLITDVLPLKAKENQWELPQSSAKHLPVAFGLYSSDSLPGLQILDPNQQRVEVPVWQSGKRPNYWQLKFWPEQAGWYTAITAGDTAVFRVDSTASSIIRAQRQQALANLKSKQGLAGAEVSKYSKKPVSPWLFYFLFIIGVGGLWLEKKLNGS
ncbi:hypothetical protein [Cesiribacter sp. SM1]|uniref:hypothetical protein n=1 Tax=Cesiribacter sp. SM1 TaxID=2861196 RepID=UPI001CD669A5|nr:hypothetical protein [Cesiribacter sp. SM1]